MVACFGKDQKKHLIEHQQAQKYPLEAKLFAMLLLPSWDPLTRTSAEMQ
ncbi:hypothetical protein [Edwardsiella piscicida]